MKEEKYDIVIPAVGTTLFVVLLLISVSLIAFTTGTCVLTLGSGEGEWTDNLVYLSITENSAGNIDSWAKFRIETNIDFDSITNFSFIHYNENGSRTPRMALEVDTNNDGIGDLWVNQWTNQTTINEWLTYSKDDWYVYPYIYGGLVHKNLSEIQGDINGTVVAVKIVIGQWLYTDAHDVVISSVKINDNELLPQPTLTPTSTPISVHRRGGGSGSVAAPKMNVPVDPATGAVTSTTTLSADGATLTIPEGTIVKDEEGNILSTPIFMLHTPTTAESVGAIAAYEFGPSGMTFEPPIDLVIAYDPADIPEGFSESDLVIRMWDDTVSEWIDLETTVDTVAHTATAKVSHFSIFALFATPPVAPPPPVTPTPTIPPATPTPTPEPTPTSTPGFEAVFAIAGLLAVAYAVRRKK